MSSEKISESPESPKSTPLPPKNVEIEHLFHNAVPYRISQILEVNVILLRECDDNFEIKAPKVLGIKTDTLLTIFTPPYQNLSFGDKIFVKKYHTKNFDISSTDKVVIRRANNRYVINFDGIVTSASYDSSLIKCYDFAYISSFSGWITDRMEFKLRHVSPEILKEIPKKSQKLGTRLRCKYIKFPADTYMNQASSIYILPSVIKFCDISSFCVISSLKSKDILISISIVEKLESIKDLSQDLIATYSCFLCSFTKDKDETISKKGLKWKIFKSGYAQVTFEGRETYANSEIKNYKNSLFSHGSIAILKLHHSDDIPSPTTDETKEIYVKINISKFEKEKKFIVGFKVKVEELVKEWHLNSANDLINAKFSLEPTDILAFWQPFIDKLVEKQDFLETTLETSNLSRAKILKAFMPNKIVESSDMQIFQLDNSDHSNQLSQKVCTEIAAEKPIIVIDGAHCTGKTKLNICIFKEIFKNIFKCQTSNSDTPKCLALVSPCKTLKPQLEMFINVDYNLYQKLRILNLIDLNDSKKYGTFLNIIELVLNGENPEKADKEKLIAAKELLKTKFCPYHHEHDGGFERDVIFPYLSKKEKYAIKDSADTYIDLITSKELKVFQDAIKVIFEYYHPNFVIASNETFISLLPSMANYISHIVIDEAGRMPFIEALNIVVETPNLKQLILNGDIQQYPYHHRIRLEQRPECYDNVLKMINLKSSELSYIQLNSTFLMHPGLVKIMNEIFYPNRNLIPLFPPESLDLCHHFRHPNIPIAFHAVEGGDELFPPTSRRNQHQNYIGIKIIQQLFENYHPAHQFRAGKILVLCNYSGQRRMMQEALKEKGYDRWVKVKCVDNVVGEHSDIVIYITTRAYDSEFKSIEEQEASGNNYDYIMETQRIQTAFSRARKALFIVGCRELLENCEIFKKIFQSIGLNIFSHVIDPLMFKNNFDLEE